MSKFHEQPTGENADIANSTSRKKDGDTLQSVSTNSISKNKLDNVSGRSKFNFKPKMGKSSEQLTPQKTAKKTKAISSVIPPDQNLSDQGAGLALLKLPAAAQIRIMKELLLEEADLPGAAIDILQSNLRWPGALRFDPQTAGDVSSSDAQVRLIDGKENFGRLILEGGARSPRTAEQLQSAAAWLTAVLAVGRQHSQLRCFAETDALSGAFNRRYFMEKVPNILEKGRIERFCVTLLIFDIDNFKQYNDQFGHAAGDAIIQEVIGLLRHCTRAKDLVARIGGDEFAVVFWDNQKPRSPDSEHPRSVLAIAQRFRKAVADHPWNTDGGPIAGRLSISGGLATFPWDAQDLPRLLEVADGELMRAKDMGKNAIVLAGPGIPVDELMEEESQGDTSNE